MCSAGQCDPTEAGGAGSGDPIPERAVFKQGALTAHHRAPPTAAAAVIVTLGVACEALASSRHDEVGGGPFP